MTEAMPLEDPWLEMLLELTETGHLSEFAITVVVGGQTMTGVLVSERDWHRLFAEQADPADATSYIFRRITERLDERQNSTPDGQLHHDFLHLKSVRMLLAGGLTDGFLTLRVRTAEVAAWSYGRLG